MNLEAVAASVSTSDPDTSAAAATPAEPHGAPPMPQAPPPGPKPGAADDPGAAGPGSEPGSEAAAAAAAAGAGGAAAAGPPSADLSTATRRSLSAWRRAESSTCAAPGMRAATCLAGGGERVASCGSPPAAAAFTKPPSARGGGGAGAGRTKAVQATRRKMAEGQEKRHEMRERMRYIMHEIDETNGRFISSRTEHEPFQFLDVCCCPGGFSTYALTAGPAPRKGIGLSLPPDLGGHLPAIPLETEQYLLHFVDVTTVAAGVRVGDMGLEAAGCPRAALRLDAALDEPPANRCQLVILDGSFLGGKDWIHKETSMPDKDNPAFNVYGSNAAAHKALLVAQLVVMANNLAPGGLLVLRLNMFPDVFTIGVLGALRLVFQGDVCSYKPRSCHVHVGSYYLVCTGFDPLQARRMQELEAEVALRQAHVLRPPPGSAAAALPPHARQRRLRVARGVLSERTAAAAAAAAAASGGGFGRGGGGFGGSGGGGGF
ncbi:hypothetical protein TSOC_013143 [Tetrabaena socialis]|uniref:Cap-specific mRNA (nucleoside-2'-O-)-methyltransferase 1 n=1 Tax=Tetrabaena socialis TaxID=47790 RepID=A0A2J7ZL55_9CHLO|nr:hypothetical protein TSOC_013143 [Tetrabaena socialis]|eukprot:PNH00994.1 hypothetical protein TSOC_013143 [Tetrabaena socialis]